MFVISAYNKPGTIHRFANTTDVLRTIEEILGLESLSQFDYFGHPLREIWSATPDLRPWAVLTPAVSLTERNPGNTPAARESAQLDLRIEDVADEELFNRVLWRSARGDAGGASSIGRCRVRRVEPGSRSKTQRAHRGVPFRLPVEPTA